MTRDSHVEHVIRETSAGGVVLGIQGLLLVKVKNLQGTVLWTLPKGHIEAGETAAQPMPTVRSRRRKPKMVEHEQ